jgi:peptidoglycan/LPS O-acetylase OafA/YrhL
MIQSINRENNFDLIRLIAAVQVMYVHGVTDFKIKAFEPFTKIVMHLPGVPIFFTISGFLIAHSALTCKNNWKKYAKNRFLRIYPALWNCLLITVVILMLFGQIKKADLLSPEILAWIAAQASFFQFYDPKSLQDWGVGSPNGSLWSVAVELQLYVFLPILMAYILPKFKTRTQQNLLLLGLWVLSIGFVFLVDKSLNNSSLLSKFIGNSVFIYLRFFFVGIALYVNFDVMKPWLNQKAIIWIALYVAWVYFISEQLELYVTINDVNLWAIGGNVLLALATLSTAFTLPKLSGMLLGGNDVSYGTYIYHMVIFNSVYQLYQNPTEKEFLFLMVFVLIIAWLSWKLVEKPALAMK